MKRIITISREFGAYGGTIGLAQKDWVMSFTIKRLFSVRLNIQTSMLKVCRNGMRKCR